MSIVPTSSGKLLVAALAAAACAAGCAADSPPHVSGHACVVFDLRIPDECGAMQPVGGLSIVEVDSQRTATTDDAGLFDLTLPDSGTSAVLRIGDHSNWRPSLVGVPELPAQDVLAPVITSTLWGTYVSALHAPDDPTMAAVHVSFKRPGEYVATAEVAGAAQLLYNQGAPFDWKPTPPGGQTVDFIAFAVPIGNGTAHVTIHSQSDTTLFDGDVPVAPGAITWLHVGP